jgi:hypothetical protein
MKFLNALASDIAFSLRYIEQEEKATYLAFYDPLACREQAWFLRALACDEMLGLSIPRTARPGANRRVFWIDRRRN